MVTTFGLLPRAGAENSGTRTVSPKKVHSVYGGAGRSSGWNSGIQSPPPMGNAPFLVASMRKSSFIWSSFSGIWAARSLAWLQSSSRLYSSHVSLSGVQSRMPGGRPRTHGTRGPKVEAIHPLW